MSRCEDFPCCGHEAGCCPDYDRETGRQLNMKCTCGAVLPVDSRYSLCDSCLRCPEEGDIFDCLDDDDYYDSDCEYDSECDEDSCCEEDE